MYTRVGILVRTKLVACVLPFPNKLYRDFTITNAHCIDRGSYYVSIAVLNVVGKTTRLTSSNSNILTGIRRRFNIKPSVAYIMEIAYRPLSKN